MILPDYRDIASKVKANKAEVKDQEIENTLKWLQKSRAKLTLKNAPAEKGDFIEIEYSIKAQDKNKELSSLKDGFILGEGHFVPGFEDNLIGMKAGQEKKDIILDKEGKKINIDLKVISVQNIELAEINDEFAKTLGSFKSLDELKNNIKQGITLEKEQAELQKARQEILEQISKQTNIEIPDILIENEKKNILENLKKRVPEKELAKLEKTIEEQARKRIKNFLILQEIAKKENIEVSDQEVMNEVNKVLKNYPSVKEAEKSIGVDLQKLKDYTRQVIKNEKVFKLIQL